MSISIRPVAPAELEEVLPALAELLINTVNGGVPMGFLAPLTLEEARTYFLSLRPEMQRGSRVLLVAFADDRVVGTVQLMLSSPPNAKHRAEVHKLFVDAALRGQGLGKALMIAVHEAARQRNRSIVFLNTRHRGSAESFYKELAYREAGVLPGWTIGSAGERYDHVTLYREL